MPRLITASGIHDSGEIMRRNWITSELARATRGWVPISRPSGRPSSTASSRLSSTRTTLVSVCRSSSPSAHSAQAACQAFSGEKRSAMADP